MVKKMNGNRFVGWMMEFYSCADVISPVVSLINMTG